jgi:hypothetical protein
MNLLKKINVSQIILTLTPFEWIFFPRSYRITPDMWTTPNGNYTRILFLFIDIKIFHHQLPSLDKK